MTTASEVKVAVAVYLRYKRQCRLVTFERGTESFGDFPDVLAVTDDMRLIEVEVKVSLSDFKADAKKRKWLPYFAREWQGRRTFFYAVPFDLAEKVRPLLRPGLGLLRCGGGVGLASWVDVAVKPNYAKERISIKAFMDLVRGQTGTLVGLACKCVRQEQERKVNG
jgi:hypothetical protein